VTETASKRVVWRYRHTVLALAVLANFTQLGSRLAISPVVPRIIDSFTVSKGAIGLALTGMWAAYALVQFPSGVLGDRFGERRVVLLALGLLGLGSLLLALAPSFVLFAVFAVFLGAGAGLFYPVAASLLTRLFEGAGQSLGFLTAGGSLSGLVAPVAAVWVADRAGWRAALAIGAALALPTLVLFAWQVRDTEPERPDQRLRDRVDSGELVELLSRPPVAFTTAIAVCTFFFFQALASFFPTFLIEYRGLSAARAGTAFGAVFLLSSALLPAVGELSDRLDRDAVLAGDLLLAVAGLAVLLLGGSGLAVTVAGVGLLGLGLSWAGVLQARFMDAFSAGERAGGFGLVRMVYMLLGASGSVVTGVLADTTGWLPAFGVPAGLLSLAVLGLLADRTFGLGL
jgi:MFS family permease